MLWGRPGGAAAAAPGFVFPFSLPRFFPFSLSPAMAVTVTLKTLQQQTFKIRMEPHETVSEAPAGLWPLGGNRSFPQKSQKSPPRTLPGLPRAASPPWDPPGLFWGVTGGSSPSLPQFMRHKTINSNQDKPLLVLPFFSGIFLSFKRFLCVSNSLFWEGDLLNISEEKNSQNFTFFGLKSLLLFLLNSFPPFAPPQTFDFIKILFYHSP